MQPRPTPPSSAALRHPSPLQQRVLAFVEHGMGHGVVEATAGSGKTTTLVQVAQALSQEQAACFLAFNRSTAAELRLRLPEHVEATTIHALGRAMLVRHLPHLASASPDGGKYRSLALSLVAERLPASPQPGVLAEYLAKLADLCRLALVGSRHARPAAPNTPATAAEVSQRHQLRSPLSAAETAELHALLPDLLARGLAEVEAGRLDYTDMLYATLELRLEPPRYAFVCIDEAQDLSPLTLAIVMNLVRAGARALFVGDPKQAIYAFAGADSRSLERITNETRATVLPLSVSFRCPTRHVVLARRFSPTIQAASGAEDGLVTLTQAAQLPRLVSPGDLVMCRVNAPLAGLALDLAETGTPVRVLGSDLAGPALSLARRLFPDGAPRNAKDVVEQHARDEQRELEEALITSPALAEVLELSRQRHRALTLLLANSGSATTNQRLEQLAHTLLSGPPPAGTNAPTAVKAAVLSTVHKAKGREAERVFLLYPEELVPHAPTRPHPRSGIKLLRALRLGASALKAGRSARDTAPPARSNAAEPVDDEAEANVLFVALTRAKHELVLVERQKGALAARLTHARAAMASKVGSSEHNDDLARRWSQVLSLAYLMSRQPRKRTPKRRPRVGPGLSSPHGTAW